MTSWIDIAAITYLAGYVAAHVYGWRHQRDPFWRGFCNPFGINRDRLQ